MSYTDSSKLSSLSNLSSPFMKLPELRAPDLLEHLVSTKLLEALLRVSEGESQRVCPEKRSLS